MKSTEAKLEFPLLLANLKGKGKVPQTGHDALLIVERNTYEDLQSQINATVPTLLPNLKNMIMTIDWKKLK